MNKATSISVANVSDISNEHGYDTLQFSRLDFVQFQRESVGFASHCLANTSTVGFILYATHQHFLTEFIAQKIYTVCTRENYKIVPLTNLKRYLHYGTSGTEEYV